MSMRAVLIDQVHLTVDVKKISDGMEPIAQVCQYFIQLNYLKNGIDQIKGHADILKKNILPAFI
jgi:hypothetical protein